MKVLVIQQKMIGDVLASSIICNNLKKIFPDCQVDYLIYPFTKPVVENNPSIDNVIPFDEKSNKNTLKLLNFAFKIRKKKYDIVIDAYAKLESQVIVALSGAPKKIGYKKSSFNFVYNNKVADINSASRNAGNALENRLNLLAPFGTTSALDLKPKIYLTKNELDQAKQTLVNHQIDLKAKRYMISILGSDFNKSYPAPFMAKLLDFVVAKTAATLLFNFIPKQADEVAKIYKLCRPETQEKINLEVTGKSIREFLALTHYCNALIGNEGGAVNMAKALNVPTYTIFSTWINKNSWNSFEDGTTNVSVHLMDFKPELYPGKSAKDMKNKALELYQEFTPELILDSLEHYIALN